MFGMKVFAVPFLLAIAQIHATAITTTDEAKYRIDFYKALPVPVPKEPFSLEDFLNHACSACYINLPLKESQLYKYNNTSGYLLDGNGTEYASGEMYKNTSSVLYQSLSASRIKFWTDCCQSAENCAAAMESHMDETSTCMPVWDGLQCWLNPEKAIQNCPSFYAGYINDKPSLCRRIVRKLCIGGKWSKTYDFCRPLEYYRWTSNNWTAVDDRCCNTELSFSLSYESFRLYTCARCYIYAKIYEDDPKNTLRFDLAYGFLYNESARQFYYYADLEKNTTEIESNLGSEYDIKRWKDCCHKAVECCDTMLATKQPTDVGNFCPATWDGWSCFSYTKRGETAREACPYYINPEYRQKTRACIGQSKRTCHNNGSWFFNDARGTEFTIYECSPEGVQTEEIYAVSLYSVSLVFLCIALIPFFFYRQLHVHRITVHKNLFIALALTCFFIILQKRFLFLDALEKPNDYNNSVRALNGPGCKILQVLYEYSLLASHCWMLCEGFYLHKLITSAFSEQKNLRLFYVIGWGVPVGPVAIYAIVQKLVDDNECWITVNSLNWITNSLSTFCLIVNFLFLCNIIRVLITKLRSVQSNEPSYFRKTVRATLILLPLLGVHQILMGYSPPYPVTCVARHNYIMFKNTVLCLEGLIISFLFCYLNGEVLFLVKRSYQRFRARHSLAAQSRSRFSISTQVSSVADGGGHNATTQA